MRPSAVFLLNLVQDVHVLRPLVFMAARDFGFATRLLVSDRFRSRDAGGAWVDELQILCRDSGATLDCFADDREARQLLTGGGLLFAASESTVPNHAITHAIFRHAPPSYLRVTVQHGFECIGFRHGSGHTRSAGPSASFAADILCTWYGLPQLSALARSQAPKVVVTGPPSVLQAHAPADETAGNEGLVCENLHSVRFGMHDRLEGEFLSTFRKFAWSMGGRRGSLRLRPHPAGQYSARLRKPFPRNVALENAPIYRIDLSRFAYGISPPSSVLIDLLLADVPTAVWQDSAQSIDISNFAGLPIVSSAEQMARFAKNVRRRRDQAVSEQRKWLEAQGMPLDPVDVYRRFARLFEAAERMAVQRPRPATLPS